MKYTRTQIEEAIKYWRNQLKDGNYKHLVTEGKHWPEDYVKTAFNLIKQSKLGQASWYNDEYIRKDLDNIVSDFTPLSHKNSNLGFFMAIIRWFIEYSGSSIQKYQEFLERKLDTIIKTLLKVVNDKSYDSQREAIKKMTFAQFEKLAEEINSRASIDDIQTTKANAKYNVVPIYSYEELHNKYGGNVTGYKGDSEWCHTNGKSTYNSWTKNGTQMFFVIEQDGWQKIKAPSQEPNDCYDAYGMSLIAILVDIAVNKLLNSTSRWNHVVLPKSGAADTMFENWAQLNKAIGINVEKMCKDECAELRKKINARLKRANAEVAKILSQVDEIKEDTIPKNIKKHITSVVIPSNVTSIKWFAFEDCTNLTSVTIGNSVTSIGEEAFAGCTNLENVAIPDSVTSIGERAFYSCHKLINLEIPNSVKTIGEFAFAYCHDLKNMTIPNSVERIESYAFNYCTSLTSITIPDSVTFVGNGAFSECNNLANVTLGNGITHISYSQFRSCTSLERITIPDSVKSIGNYAFYYCANIASVTIPDSVKSIGSYAFCFCVSLKHIAIPSSVVDIGNYAFYCCGNLENMTIPASVKAIGEYTFKSCNNLKRVVFEGKTLKQVKAMKYYPWGIKDESIVQAEG